MGTVLKQTERSEPAEDNNSFESQGMKRLKDKILSALLEVRTENGIIPISLLRYHVKPESRTLFIRVLQEMTEEGPFKFAWCEGYDLGMRYYCAGTATIGDFCPP